MNILNAHIILLQVKLVALWQRKHVLTFTNMIILNAQRICVANKINNLMKKNMHKHVK